MHFEKYLDKAYHWLFTYGPKILLGIVILIVGLWLIRILSNMIRKAFLKKELDASLQSFLLSTIVICLRLGLVLALMQFLGIQMTIFAAIIGAFGVAAGLALSGTLQNFTSGILILLLKPFNIGDNIITQGKEGTVTDIQIFYTTITTFDGIVVIVPNIKLTSEVIINVTREGKMRMDIELKSNYSSDLEQLKNVIISTAGSMDKLVKGMEPRIGVSSIDDNGYKIMVNLWVQSHGYEDTKLEYQEKLIQNLRSANVKVAGM